MLEYLVPGMLAVLRILRREHAATLGLQLTNQTIRYQEILRNRGVLIYCKRDLGSCDIWQFMFLPLIRLCSLITQGWFRSSLNSDVCTSITQWRGSYGFTIGAPLYDLLRSWAGAPARP